MGSGNVFIWCDLAWVLCIAIHVCVHKIVMFAPAVVPPNALRIHITHVMTIIIIIRISMSIALSSGARNLSKYVSMNVLILYYASTIAYTRTYSHLHTDWNVFTLYRLHFFSQFRQDSLESKTRGSPSLLLLWLYYDSDYYYYYSVAYPS